PFWMALLTGFLFGFLFDKWSRVAAVLAMLAVVIYPWPIKQDASYEYQEHSIAEEWGINLGTAAGGSWVSTPDRRWTLDRAGFALVDRLKGEIAAGRITLATHVLHITHDVIVNRGFNRFSVFTGINDDPIVYEIPAQD